MVRVFRENLRASETFFVFGQGKGKQSTLELRDLQDIACDLT